MSDNKIGSLPACIRCKSDRLVHIGGKTSDMFDMSFHGEQNEGYVPSDLFFGQGGFGDYFNIEFCAECGQIQFGFPISDRSIKEGMEGM